MRFVSVGLQIFIRLSVCGCMVLSGTHAVAQARAGAGNAANAWMPTGVSDQKVAEFLATLKPPASLASMEFGQNLSLAAPDIAASGLVRVQLSSELPRNESMWLLTLDPQPDGGSTLLASVGLSPSVLAKTELQVNLYKTQHLLLVVRAGGKYYGVTRHIKIGTPAQGRVQK